MKIELRALILTSGSTRELISDRVYWRRRPQNSALPAVVLELISVTSDYELDGPSGLIQSRVQVNCFGDTYKQAEDVLITIRSLLNGYSGIQGDVQFQLITVDNQRDDNDQESGADRFLFRNSMDLQISHDE